MFRVEVDNKVFGVRFQYRPVALIGDPNDFHFSEVEVEDERKFVGDPSLRTICQILDLNSGIKDEEGKEVRPVLAFGHATCDHRDKFDKNEGRWRSFQSAISNFRDNNFIEGETKAKRKKFYHAYFRNHKHKRHVLDRVK